MVCLNGVTGLNMAARATAKAVPVFFVRHGESTNNTILRRLFKAMREDSLTRAEVESEWGAKRSTDPDLTEVGKAEARMLGEYLGLGLDTRTKHFKVYTSAFKRTCDTTQGILEGLRPEKYSVTVRADIFESGGVYTFDKEGKRTGPGACFERDEILARYGYGVDLLPTKGQWYTGGWETDQESRKRASGVAAWIKSDEFYAAHNDGDTVVLLVMHAHFIDHLLKAMLEITSDEGRFDTPGMNDYGLQPMHFETANTATSLFLVNPSVVVTKWIGSTSHLEKTPKEVLSSL